MINKKILIISIILFVILLIIIFLNNILQNFTNISKIPYTLFKTGPFTHNNIPSELKERIDITNKNLKCKYYYYDDQQCYDFIKNNYSNKILKAYDSLIPNAFKADLWRFLILYKFGGIYGDLSQKVLIPYDINKGYCDMLLVKDLILCGKPDTIAIAFMATRPNNNFFKYVIDNLTTDILNKRLGVCPLDVTGPIRIGTLYKKYYNLDKISTGVQILTGLDNKKYKINFFAEMKTDNVIKTDNLIETHGNIYLLNRKKFIDMKSKNHEKLVYSLNTRYHKLYEDNKIFK